MGAQIDRARAPRARAAAWLGSGLLAGLLLAGCVQPPDGEAAGAGPQSGDPSVGSFSMQLTLGGGYKFGEVSYTISGNGFQKTGSVDVAASATVSTVVGGIPFGTGYQLELTAQDADHKLTPCVGSATFEITAAATVPVPVHLICHAIPKPAAVPLPRWAVAMLAGLLLAFGAGRAQRRARARSGVRA